MKKDRLYTVGKNIKAKKFDIGGLMPMPAGYQLGNLELPTFQVAQGQPLSSGIINNANDYYNQQVSEGGGGSSSNFYNAANKVLTAASPGLVAWGSGGYSTGGVGEGISTAFNAAGDLVGAIPGVDAAAAPILKAVGIGAGIIANRGFGVKENKENIAALKENRAVARSAAKGFNNVSTTNGYFNAAGNMTSSLGFKASDLYKNGWWTDKGTEMGNAANAGEAGDIAYQNHAGTTAALRVDANQDSNTRRAFISAYGGPLSYMGDNDMGVIDYDLITRDLTRKEKETDAKNKLAGISPTNAFCGGGHLFPYGGGTFTGAGTTSRWGDEHTDSYPGVKDFNEAFDKAVAENQKTFWFQGREYNTQKENNPVREFNNRWVGALRSPNVKNPSKAYDKQAGPIGGPMSLIPMVTDTYNPELVSPIAPEMEYDPYVYQKYYSPLRSYPLTSSKAKPIMEKLNTRAEGGSLFALGGDVQTNGADYPTGLTHIDAGGSHEMNPNEGVQVGVDQEGTPNLVEEGETIFNDYVFSNRIKLDDEAKKAFHISKKRDITYAEMSKKLEKEASERPNDPISKTALKAQLQELSEHQERQKQEMEAERAREAFEALSPEEQTAVMQQIAQQEQAAQEQAMQEEAMAQQQAQDQQMQMSPEEAAMMQQQQMQGQSKVVEGQPVMAYGGKINKFAPGGDTEVGVQEAGILPAVKAEDLLTATDTATLQRAAIENSDAIKQMMYEGYSIPEIIRAAIFKSLGFSTQSQFDEWAKANNIGKVNWEKLSTNKNFINALKKKNPALADVVSRGYDFGQFNPDQLAKATIQSISRGNWKTTNGKGWRGSSDLAFQQATKGMSDAEIDALSTEQLAEKMRNTDAYKNTSKWLENSDNALLYLNTLLNDEDTPEVAKEYARKFVQNGKWKDGFNYDYATVFGSNGKGVRETDPGTYWHSVAEANRGNQVKNLLWNRDKEIWEDIVGDIPTNLKLNNTYTWNDPSNQYTYNYYMGPGREFHRVEGHTDYLDGTPDTWQGVGKETRRETLPNGDVVIYHAAENGAGANENRDIVPNLRSEWPRYLGLFGPAVGLGMQALGIGRPNTKGLDSVIDAYDKTGASLADYRGIGNYLSYNPLDIWSGVNRLNANSRATDRAIMNSGAVQGSQAASLLANAYNNQIGSGNLFRQAQEYNDNLRKMTAEFNRGTDQFNASAYNQAALANADIKNRDRQFRAQLGMQAEAQKMDADAGWYNGIYGNVAGLFKGISDIGRENAERNMLARLAASGALGRINPEGAMNAGLIKYAEEQAAEGGQLKRKKNKRRGLTI